MEIKEILWQKCMDFVSQRALNLREFMDSNQQALFEETKSSAGDKHETGRAMLQLEMEKASQQLEGLRKMQEALKRIDPRQRHDSARLGSLVKTSAGNYFLSISAGELDKIGEEKYFALSTSSPLGKLLLGKRKGESFSFRSREVLIMDLV